MTDTDETLTKLSGFDRVIISLIGLVVILGLAAVMNAPLMYGALAGTIFAVSAQIYGRLERPRDRPDPRRARSGDENGMFNQRAIADSLNEAVWIISPREQIVYANDAAEAMFGTASPTRSYPARRLATVMRNPELRRLVSDTLEGRPTEPVDYESSVPVDRHLRVTATALDVPRADDSPRRFAMLVFYDITDLVKFAVTQGDFLANASHELKTPVSSLLGYIETLRGHAKDDPKAREKFLAIMQEQAERMQRLISDLLSLRQIEQSEHIAPTSSADLRAAAQFAVDTAAPLAKTRGVSVNVAGPDALMVKGDSDELVQLCLNIIDNAVKMSPKGSRVDITLSQKDVWRAQDFMGLEDPASADATKRMIVSPPLSENGYALLEIKDQGPGFAPKHIPRLGERFYRIAGDRSSREKGTGLGLAIVKHIIFRHRGGLLIESRSAQEEDILFGSLGAEPMPGKADEYQTGTSFTAILPLAD